VKALLADLIRRNRRITATELTQITGKHKSTVSPYLQNLLSSGIIREAGTSASGSRGGKPRQYLELNPDHSYAIGVDASSTRLNGGVYNFQGRQVASREERYSDQRDGEAFLRDLYRFIEDMVALSGTAEGKCLGVGVGFSGHIDSRSGRIFQSRAIGLRDYDLVADLRKRFGLPVCIQNDANAALLGEKWFSLDYDSKNPRNVLYLFIENYFMSLGFGILINGSLYEGAQSFAGELTNYSIDRKIGPEIIESLRACDAASLSFVAEDKGGATPQAGTPSAAARWTFDAFSDELVYVFELLNPELLIIGGNFNSQYDFFLEPFVEYTREKLRSKFEPYIQIDLRASEIKYPPVCAGATVPLFQSLIESL
jgi:predicted NBD/HSP70 family sugar kinase